MRKRLMQLLETAWQKTVLTRPEQDVEIATIPDTVTLVAQAKQEWDHAANYFNNVSDPELVDHAILLREAAERRYMYLLKQAKLTETRAFIWEDELETVSPSANEPA